MHCNRMKWMVAALGAVAVSGLVGCGKEKINARGAASVSVKALSIADIANVRVTVQGATMPAPIMVPLVKKGQQFSAVVSDLPVGTDYSFTASATDAASVELYHGGVTGQIIEKNKTANIVINMNQVAPGVPLANEAPVIDSLTATSLSVSNNDLVTLKAGAHDPDTGDTAGMAWVWESTCLGTLSGQADVAGSDVVRGTSQITFTSPATDGPCTVRVIVKDARNPDWLQTKASLVIQVNAASANGNAKITALPNTCPVVSNLYASPVPVVVGAPTTLTVLSSDSDGDALTYQWTSPDCTGTFTAASAASTDFTLTTAPANNNCTFLVVVTDGTFPNGDAKCSLTNHLSLPVHSAADTVVGAPIFGYDYQSQDTISGGDQVNLAIVASEGCAGGTISLDWAASDGVGLLPTTPAAIGLDGNLFTSAVVYPAQPGAEDGAVVTVTVTATCSSSGLSSSHAFTLVPLNSFCFGKADNTDCTPVASATNKCILAAKCVAAVCVVQTQVTCAPTSELCKTNACLPATGVCALQNQADDTACSDSLLCTENDKCTAGICGGQAKVCASDGNLCHVGFCNAADGSCGIANAADGTSCNDGDLCTGATAPGDICTAGVCAGAATECQAGFVCTPSTGTCDPRICMNPSFYARKVVPPLMGLGISPAGTPWIAGQIYNPFDFGTGTLSSSGSADIYLAKINPATGLADLVFTFGDVASKDQVASGVAVAAQGNIGLIGTTTGEIQFTDKNSDGSAPGGEGVAGLDYLSATALTPFYAVFDGASTGTVVTPVKEHMVDVGTGSLLSIASNPNANAFAFCGKTSKQVPNWSTSATNKGVILPTGTAVAGGGMDIIVAKVDATTGNVVWGRQFGGAADQVCDSVTVANNGDVIIAGNYTGTLNFSATVTLPVVSDTTAGLFFVAKLASADGLPIAAATWGTSGRNNAYGVTVDASDNIVVAGSLNGNIDFGGGIAITNTGLTDVFAVKLTSALAPVWAKSFGDSLYDQSAKVVGVSAGGDVFIGGSFKGTLGALGLTSSSTTALDAFTAQLAAADGTPLCAHVYGDAAGAQAVSGLTVARAASGALANSIMFAGAFSSDITLGSSTLSTGSASLSASFLSRLAP